MLVKSSLKSSHTVTFLDKSILKSSRGIEILVKSQVKSQSQNIFKSSLKSSRRAKFWSTQVAIKSSQVTFLVKSSIQVIKSSGLPNPSEWTVRCLKKSFAKKTNQFTPIRTLMHLQKQYARNPRSISDVQKGDLDLCFWIF